MENTHNIKFIILTIFKCKFLWQLVCLHCCAQMIFIIQPQNFIFSGWNPVLSNC